MILSTREEHSLLGYISLAAQSLTVVPYQPKHLSQYTPQESQKDWENIDEKEPGFSESIHAEGLSFTLLDKDENIVSCFGVFPHDDYCLSWAIHSELFHKYVIEVTRITKTCLNELKHTKEFRIAYTSVKADFEGGHKWIKALGFEEAEDQFEVEDANFVLYGKVLV